MLYMQRICSIGLVLFTAVTAAAHNDGWENPAVVACLIPPTLFRFSTATITTGMMKNAFMLNFITSTILPTH